MVAIVCTGDKIIQITLIRLVRWLIGTEPNVGFGDLAWKSV